MEGTILCVVTFCLVIGQISMHRDKYNTVCNLCHIRHVTTMFYRSIKNCKDVLTGANSFWAGKQPNLDTDKYRSLGEIWCEKIFVGCHIRQKLNTRKFSYHTEIQ